MENIALRRYTDNSTIFQGKYDNIKECLEHAIKENISLSHINLKNQNLSNANIDGCHMPYANFCGANLTGANLSEANLSGSIFHNSSLYNTCLSYSNLKNCDFRNSNFGATMIEEANIQGCKFSTFSSFNLDFQYASNMSNCVFETIDGEKCSMSVPPIIVKGLLNVPIVIFDDLIKIGTKTFSKSHLLQLLDILNTNTKQIAA